MFKRYLILCKELIKISLQLAKFSGHEFHIALIKVAIGIAKNTPQKPNIAPNTKTANIIITGCSLTASEKSKGTNKYPSRICKDQISPH